MFVVCCLAFVARFVLLVACGSMSVAIRLLLIVCCVLCVACLVCCGVCFVCLRFVSCVLCVVYRLLFVARWLLFVVACCGVLFVVCACCVVSVVRCAFVVDCGSLCLVAL